MYYLEKVKTLAEVSFSRTWLEVVQKEPSFLKLLTKTSALSHTQIKTCQAASLFSPVYNPCLSTENWSHKGKISAQSLAKYWFQTALLHLLLSAWYVAKLRLEMAATIARCMVFGSFIKMLSSCTLNTVYNIHSSTKHISEVVSQKFSLWRRGQNWVKAGFS